jgi:hypothetical protein
MDRAIIWIREPPVVVGNEVYELKTAIIYYVAIHADLQTLRGGTSYVLGTWRMFCKECSVIKHNNHKKELLKFPIIVIFFEDEQEYQSVDKFDKYQSR